MEMCCTLCNVDWLTDLWQSVKIWVLTAMFLERMTMLFMTSQRSTHCHQLSYPTSPSPDRVVCVCVWAVIAIYAGNYWQCEGRKARIFARPNHENESYHSAGCGVGRERPFYPTLFLLVSLFILLQVTITTVVEYRSEVETEVCLGQVYLLLLTVCDIKVKFVVGLSS